MHIGNTEIEIVRGDITTQQVDVIVNAANDHLWMGAGVAGAIKRKGGIFIEQEAMQNGPIAIGESRLTEAGMLPAKFVIHSAVMGQDLVTSAEYIKAATRSALKLASDLKLLSGNYIHSIAFPAFGTGVGGFSFSECAEIMIRAVVEFLENPQPITLIRFVLFDNKAAEIFSTKLFSIEREFRLGQ